MFDLAPPPSVFYCPASEISPAARKLRQLKVLFLALKLKQIDMARVLLALIVSVALLGNPVTAVEWNPTKWEVPSLFGEAPAPGTPQWWKKYKKKAEMVPGEGYRVEGFEGFYDQEGRPIRERVAKKVNQKDTKGLLKEISVSGAMTNIKTQVGLGPDEAQAKLAYEKGEDLFQREKYAEAAKAFKETISRAPGSNLAQDAKFMLAESYFFAHEYPDAVDTYDELIGENPNSKHLDKIVRRQFDIARYWEAHHQGEPHWATTPNLLDDTRPLFDTLGRSLKVYENIRLNDPTGPLADDAIMATANSYFLRGRYEDADYNYELIRTEYPRSDHQFEAHILGLQCKMRMYQGPDYDGGPLLEAKKLSKQIRVQFVGQLNDEDRSRLQVDEAKLQKLLAEREMSRAEYYKKNGYNGSAKFHYARVARQFSGTPIANEARQAYAALDGQPERPDVKMESLINLFPDNAERQAIAQIPLLNPEPANQLDPESESETMIARPPQNPTGEGSIYR